MNKFKINHFKDIAKITALLIPFYGLLGRVRIRINAILEFYLWFDWILVTHVSFLFDILPNGYFLFCFIVLNNTNEINVRVLNFLIWKILGLDVLVWMIEGKLLRTQWPMVAESGVLSGQNVQGRAWRFETVTLRTSHN